MSKTAQNSLIKIFITIIDKISQMFTHSRKGTFMFMKTTKRGILCLRRCEISERLSIVYYVIEQCNFCITE